MALVGFERASWAPLVKALRSIQWRVLGHSPISRVSQALGSGGELARVRLLLWQVKNDSPQSFDSAHRALSSIAQLPLAPTQVVVGRGLSPAQVAALYSAGARAVFPVEDAAEQALTLGLGKLLSDIRADQFKLESAQSAELKTWLHAKQLTQGMQEALQRANIALELMRVASTSLERAVFFLKKEDELIGLGAFGLTSSQTPMADALRGMALKIPGSGQLRQVLELRRPTIAPWQELGLGSLFFDTAGRPAGSEAAVIPVLGSSRVIALVYGDNGPFNRPITNLEPLEMVAGQAGMAYENALLRMQLGLGTNTTLRPEPERSARALQAERSGGPAHSPQQG